MCSCKIIIFWSAEAVVSLLGSLKIVARLRAHHYHLSLADSLSCCAFCPPPTTFFSTLGFPDVLFIHSLQYSVYFFVKAFIIQADRSRCFLKIINP